MNGQDIATNLKAYYDPTPSIPTTLTNSAIPALTLKTESSFDFTIKDQLGALINPEIVDAVLISTNPAKTYLSTKIKILKVKGAGY